MPITQMLQQTSAHDLAEYMALERIEGPFGDLRADMRAGIVASAVVNHSMSPPKTPTKPMDFMPFVKRQAPVQIGNLVAHGKLLARSLFGMKAS